jgi:hypothetical protein
MEIDDSPFLVFFGFIMEKVTLYVAATPWLVLDFLLSVRYSARNTF